MSKYSKLKSFKDYLKSNKPSPSGLIICFGSRGVGKSTTIAKRFLQWECDKHKSYDYFYTNISIYTDNPNYRYLDLSKNKFTDYLNPNNKIIQRYHCSTYDFQNKNIDFFIEPNSIICLDELGILYNNRQYKSFPHELTTFLKLLRKLGILLICNSQSYDIDKSIRNSASELRLMTKAFGFNISRKIKKFITISNSEEKAESQIMDSLQLAPLIEKGSVYLTFIPFYTNLFNSFE